MIYSGNRNYGCRFKEVIFHNTKTIILENEKISTMILVDRGTDIISLNHKATDTEFMWTNPVGLNILDKMNFTQWDEEYWGDNYYGGWFECFPNMGTACTYNGRVFTDNAEIKYLPFDYSVIKDSEKEVTLKFFALCSKTPFAFEKYITIKSNEPTLFISEKITNLSDIECPYLWGHHPNVGGRFLDESIVVDLPDCTASEDFSSEKYDSWPNLKNSNKTENVSKIMSKGEGKANALFYIDKFSAGWGAIRNTNKKLGIGFSWDVDTFNSGLIWFSYNKSEVNPYYDGRRLITIFPRSANVNCLEEAQELNRLSYLKPHESKETWLNVTVFESDNEVSNIDKNGTVSYK